MGRQPNPTKDPILTSMSKLESRLNLLHESNLDTLSNRISTLTNQFELLNRQRHEPNAMEAIQSKIESEKITTLYEAYDDLSDMDVLLPGILQRLQSLKKVHDETFAFTDRLKQMEANQLQLSQMLGNDQDLLRQVRALNPELLCLSIAHFHARVDGEKYAREFNFISKEYSSSGSTRGNETSSESIMSSQSHGQRTYSSVFLQVLGNKKNFFLEHFPVFSHGHPKMVHSSFSNSSCIARARPCLDHHPPLRIVINKISKKSSLSWRPIKSSRVEFKKSFDSMPNNVPPPFVAKCPKQ